MRDRNAILLSGYAKPPANITAEAVYSTLVVAVLVDRRSGIILEAEASVVTELSKTFISDLLVGYNLNDGPEPLISLFEEFYFGSTKRALETALRMIFQRFQEYQATQEKPHQ